MNVGCLLSHQRQLYSPPGPTLTSLNPWVHFPRGLFYFEKTFWNIITGDFALYIPFIIEKNRFLRGMQVCSDTAFSPTCSYRVTHFTLAGFKAVWHQVGLLLND